jgi:membrane protein implicated in regulation of membrane protease activity
MFICASAQAGLIVLKAFGVTHYSWWLISAPLWIAALGFLLVVVVLCVIGGYVSLSEGHLEQDSNRFASQHQPDALPVRLHRQSR